MLHQKDALDIKAARFRLHGPDYISPCGRIIIGMTGVVGRWMVDVDGSTLRGKSGSPRYLKWAVNAICAGRVAARRGSVKPPPA